MDKLTGNTTKRPDSGKVLPFETTNNLTMMGLVSSPQKEQRTSGYKSKFEVQMQKYLNTDPVDFDNEDLEMIFNELVLNFKTNS
jgi:hypothetical protein